MSDLVGGWLTLPDSGKVGGWLELPKAETSKGRTAEFESGKFTGHGQSGIEKPSDKFKNGKERISYLMDKNERH